MIKTKFLFLFCLLAYLGQAQITDDFSDGNLTANPSWLGDVDSFIVNGNLELQLNATEGGSATLFLPYTAEDSLYWEFWQLLDFSPSGSNRLRTYLNIDQMDPTLASGYFIEVGESGSEDAIKFYKLDQGDETLLGSATLGAMGTDPALARIKVKRNPGGIWILEADYTGGNMLEEEFELVNEDLAVSGNKFFGFEAEYTSTRIDKFHFDDIEINSFVGSGLPSLTEVTRINNDSLVLSFSKVISTENDNKTSRISIDQGIGNPSSMLVNTLNKNKLELKLNTPLSGGITYQLCSEGITDNGGNASQSECQEIFLESLPQPGDIVINEILFNPVTGAFDYVEIINPTNKVITLDQIFFANQHNGQSKELEIKRTIAPGEILAFTKDPNEAILTYDPIAPAQIIENAQPAYNVDEGNYWIYREENGMIITLDSVEYLDSYHFELLDEVKGVSLERIRVDGPSNDPSNWHSGSETTSFGTPGYANSNGFVISETIEDVLISPKVFSPNGDSDNDFLNVLFDVKEPGFLATVQIYNDRGFPIRQLANNLLIAPNSAIKWDGLTDEGVLADLGIYIILVKLFKPDGQVIQVKSSCVLANFLD